MDKGKTPSANQLMYFFLRGASSYEQHLANKKQCMDYHERIMQGMPLQDKNMYESLYEANNVYWHEFSECERRIYELIISLEKDYGVDQVNAIVASVFDVNAQQAGQSGLVLLKPVNNTDNNDMEM